MAAEASKPEPKITAIGHGFRKLSTAVAKFALFFVVADVVKRGLEHVGEHLASEMIRNPHHILAKLDGLRLATTVLVSHLGVQH